MKRGTTSHPKVYTLAALLDIPRWGAVGILESLWHFAQSYAQDGTVGRYPDEAIARAIGWEGNAATLVSCLVQAGWLERCQCHRARIHDWPEHADQTVQRALSVRAQGFASCYDDASTLLAPDEREPEVKIAAVPCRAVPSLTKPEPKPAAESRRKKPAGNGLDSPRNREAVDAYNAAFGSRIEYIGGNLQAAERAYVEGYTVEQFRAVFGAVAASSTPTALWCRVNNHAFEYLIRPPYKRKGDMVQGPLDKILNELAEAPVKAPDVPLPPAPTAEQQEASRREWERIRPTLGAAK
jgi:hypothetical protein